MSACVSSVITRSWIARAFWTNAASAGASTPRCKVRSVGAPVCANGLAAIDAAAMAVSKARWRFIDRRSYRKGVSGETGETGEGLSNDREGPRRACNHGRAGEDLRDRKSVV